jgi:hypothetical protein
MLNFNSPESEPISAAYSVDVFAKMQAKIIQVLKQFTHKQALDTYVAGKAVSYI